MAETPTYVDHIVLLNIRKDAPKQSVDTMLKEIHGLSKIPDVLSVTAGTNFSTRSCGFTHGLVVRFPNQAAANAYQTHPEHERVRDEILKPLLSPSGQRVLAVDYISPMVTSIAPPVDNTTTYVAAAAFGGFGLGFAAAHFLRK